MSLKFDGDKITFGDNTTLNSANISAHNHDDRYYTETEIDAFQIAAQISFNNIQSVVSTKADLNASIFSLGVLSGTNAINFSSNRVVQTLTLNGNTVELTKGNGWPTNNSIADIILRITVSSATSVTWSIINDWFAQPPAGALSVGTHLFLLRAIGASVIEGHYIGRKTN